MKRKKAQFFISIFSICTYVHGAISPAIAGVSFEQIENSNGEWVTALTDDELGGQSDQLIQTSLGQIYSSDPARFGGNAEILVRGPDFELQKTEPSGGVFHKFTVSQMKAKLVRTADFQFDDRTKRYFLTRVETRPYQVDFADSAEAAGQTCSPRTLSNMSELRAALRHDSPSDLEKLPSIQSLVDPNCGPKRNDITRSLVTILVSMEKKSERYFGCSQQHGDTDAIRKKYALMVVLEHISRKSSFIECRNAIPKGKLAEFDSRDGGKVRLAPELAARGESDGAKDKLFHEIVHSGRRDSYFKCEEGEEAYAKSVESCCGLESDANSKKLGCDFLSKPGHRSDSKCEAAIKQNELVDAKESGIVVSKISSQRSQVREANPRPVASGSSLSPQILSVPSNASSSSLQSSSQAIPPTVGPLLPPSQSPTSVSKVVSADVPTFKPVNVEDPRAVSEAISNGRGVIASMGSEVDRQFRQIDLISQAQAQTGSVDDARAARAERAQNRAEQEADRRAEREERAQDRQAARDQSERRRTGIDTVSGGGIPAQDLMVSRFDPNGAPVLRAVGPDGKFTGKEVQFSFTPAGSPGGGDSAGSVAQRNVANADGSSSGSQDIQTSKQIAADSRRFANASASAGAADGGGSGGGGGGGGGGSSLGGGSPSAGPSGRGGGGSADSSASAAGADGLSKSFIAKASSSDLLDAIRGVDSPTKIRSLVQRQDVQDRLTALRILVRDGNQTYGYVSGRAQAVWDLPSLIDELRSRRGGG